MKVINLFPNGPEQAVTANPIHTGPVHFTCPHCNTPAEMRFNKIIFRSVEFECATCGTPFKLTNPGFVSSQTKPKLGK
jgi:transposase-like protein